jgi:hypothetical protein
VVEEIAAFIAGHPIEQEGGANGELIVRAIIERWPAVTVPMLHEAMDLAIDLRADILVRRIRSVGGLPN